MARLNEPLVSADGLEILRRKFIRQNRDIARINSTQSLRIRGLENECARMLSENLELRGHILRLESELEGSRAHRVADHALEIKEKMEAQLLEWGTMLASLGHEPTPKTKSPRATKKPRIQPSFSQRSPPRWKRRETMEETEALALQEGRLPPIWESKSFPRESLNRDEILALYRDDAEANESPDLGPPPVSRFVDEEPVKLDLPVRPAVHTAEPAERTELSLQPIATATSSDDHSKEPTEPENPISSKQDDALLTKTKNDAKMNRPETQSDKPQPALQNKSEGVGQKPSKSLVTTAQSVKTMPLTSSASREASHVNLKRKMRDDEEKLAEKPTGLKARPTQRPMKELPTSKKDIKEKTTTGAILATQRKPLGAKNSNENLSSPKKVGKPRGLDGTSKAKAAAKREEKPQPDRPTKPLQIKEPEPLQIAIPIANEARAIPVADIVLEPESLSAEPDLSIPASPEPFSQDGELQDTPPPAHISSTGETSRGSRRARTAVSYAEPNLRDKMRRPTKQLFDAVAGEGKHIRRTSHSTRDEVTPASIKSEDKPTSSWKLLPSVSEAADANKVTDITASPLAKKTSGWTGSPSSGSTEGSIRVSSSDRSGSNTNPCHEDFTTKAPGGHKISDGPAGVDRDIYEVKDSDSTTDLRKMDKPRKPRSKRTSSTARTDSLALEVTSAENGSQMSGESKSRRKRASMIAPKKSRMHDLDEDDDGEDDDENDEDYKGDESWTGSSTSSRERTSTRRRSMML